MLSPVSGSTESVGFSPTFHRSSAYRAFARESQKPVTDLTRRTVVGASLSAPVWGWTNPVEAFVRRPFTVAVRPVTSDRVSVVVSGNRLDDGDEIFGRCGATHVQRDVIDGVAVLGISVPANTRTDLTVGGASGAVVRAVADTRASAMRDSLHRVVNKRLALGPKDTPRHPELAHGVYMDHRTRAAADLMLAAARRDKAPLRVISGYRSFDGQRELYAAYRKRDGQAKADKYSARPGHSEHQLGLALDVGASNGERDLTVAFGATRAGRWLAAHAHEHGFVVRYPANLTDVTGYEPEPWHIRYLGTETATYLHHHASVQTVEQLFGLPAAGSYAS